MDGGGGGGEEVDDVMGTMTRKVTFTCKETYIVIWFKETLL